MRLTACAPWFALALCLGCSAKPTSTAGEAPKAGTSVNMSPQDLATHADLPVYPGADFPEGKSSVAAQGNESRVEIVMTTKDPVQKVSKFYASALQNAEVAGTTNTQRVMGLTKSGSYAMVTVEKLGENTEIHAVSRRSDK